MFTVAELELHTKEGMLQYATEFSQYQIPVTQTPPQDRQLRRDWMRNRHKHIAVHWNDQITALWHVWDTAVGTKDGLQV